MYVYIDIDIDIYIHAYCSGLNPGAPGEHLAIQLSWMAP